MKKTICFLLLLMLLLSFVGCRSEEAPPASSSPPSLYPLFLSPTSYGFSIALVDESYFNGSHLIESYDETVPAHVELEYFGLLLELDYEKTVKNLHSGAVRHEYSVRDTKNDIGEQGSATFDSEGNLLLMYFVEPGIPLSFAEDITDEELRAQMEKLLSEYVDFSAYDDFERNDWFEDASNISATLRWQQTLDGMGTCNDVKAVISANRLTLFSKSQLVDIPSSLRRPSDETIRAAIAERIEKKLDGTGVKAVSFEFSEPTVEMIDEKLCFLTVVTVEYELEGIKETVKGIQSCFLFPDELE